MMNPETSPVSDRILYGIYAVMMASYLLWLVHLFFNVPSLIRPAEWEVLGVLGLGTILVFSAEWIGNLWKHLKEGQDPETRFCPHCKKSVLRLVLVCPFCNRDIT
ncbi:MAG: hypothetical protein A3D92_18620 [Bacteroidetes bacterium RIFCSPHIGHO2_02_FULL_44_7]|nr:MAG: hypothetical protein A3D92_18620 [Bacteroidetes bacterium RIFCSPHIGHO2_02_FULL_44_7]